MEEANRLVMEHLRILCVPESLISQLSEELKRAPPEADVESHLLQIITCGVPDDSPRLRAQSDPCYLAAAQDPGTPGSFERLVSDPGALAGSAEEGPTLFQKLARRASTGPSWPRTPAERTNGERTGPPLPLASLQRPSGYESFSSLPRDVYNGATEVCSNTSSATMPLNFFSRYGLAARRLNMCPSPCASVTSATPRDDSRELHSEPDPAAAGGGGRCTVS